MKKVAFSLYVLSILNKNIVLELPWSYYKHGREGGHKVHRKADQDIVYFCSYYKNLED